VRSGDISIQVAGAKAAAVLGNVTTGTIWTMSDFVASRWGGAPQNRQLFNRRL